MSFLLRVALAALIAVCSGSAFAQKATGADSAAKSSDPQVKTSISDPQFTTATFNDWVAECRATPAAPAAEAAVDPKAAAEAKAKAADNKAADKKPAAAAAPDRQCEIVQTYTFKDSGRQLAKVAIGKLSGQTSYKMVVELPLSVYLPAGVAIKFDDKAEIKGPFVRCTGVSCLSELDLTPDQEAQAETAKAGSITLTDLSRRNISISMSMNGYAAAIKFATAPPAVR